MLEQPSIAIFLYRNEWPDTAPPNAPAEVKLSRRHSDSEARRWARKESAERGVSLDEFLADKSLRRTRQAFGLEPPDPAIPGLPVTHVSVHRSALKDGVIEFFTGIKKLLDPSAALESLKNDLTPKLAKRVPFEQWPEPARQIAAVFRNDLPKRFVERELSGNAVKIARELQRELDGQGLSENQVKELLAYAQYTIKDGRSISAAIGWACSVALKWRQNRLSYWHRTNSRIASNRRTLSHMAFMVKPEGFPRVIPEAEHKSVLSEVMRPAPVGHKEPPKTAEQTKPEMARPAPASEPRYVPPPEGFAALFKAVGLPQPDTS